MGRKQAILAKFYETDKNQSNLVDWIFQRLSAAALAFRKTLQNFLFRLGRLWETCYNAFCSSWLFKDDQNSPWASRKKPGIEERVKKKKRASGQF